MDDVSLVLEGGGMRGVYTSGVLDQMMMNDLFFPYVIGVSAGACNALSYLSRQPDRSRYINVNFANDPRYLHVKHLINGKGMFNMEFLFKDIANELVPFDFQRFGQAKETFVVPTTDCETGQPVYFENNHNQTDRIIEAVKASSSLPLVGVPIEIDGMTLLDGGIIDPIPIDKAIADGYKRHVIVLTRPKGYRKKPFRLKYTSKFVYRKYPKLVEALINRHIVYNQQLDRIDQLEKERKVFVIRPKGHEQVKRTEKDPERLNDLHDAGFMAGKRESERLKAWLAETKVHQYN
ncbi:putative patatin/cPLA2 family phospholipase [Streptohalobacillus salinus]|uniref:Putative patatin/cPLA2 family phospholipase n=1 Tax=Streptohalobacillus salinus TaxID=621096 RepID=A0A2V3WA49_9BACI|nr:patatin family protein [Streptohalobacillus salinus]PXW90972.1 putative patatin/cPLA2 family phospholipase [Streptohalobacillus salinus]